MPGMLKLEDLPGEQGADATDPPLMASPEGSLWQLCWRLANIWVRCSRLDTSCACGLQLGESGCGRELCHAAEGMQEQLCWWLAWQ